MSKKLFGIPALVLVVVMVLVVGLSGGSYVIGKYAFNESFNSTLTILSDKLGAYSDVNCTIPFDTSVSLQFGSVFGGGNSSIVSFFIRNESDGASYIKPQISVENLPVGIEVWEMSGGLIPLQPEWLNLYTPEKLTWTPTGLVGQVGYENLPANATQMFISIENMQSAGLIKIDDEIIKYNSIDTTDRWVLKGLLRGQCGTIPATHARATNVIFGNAQYTALNALELGEVQTISLMVKTSEEVESGNVNFNVLLQAESEH
jgi:hypothetical protein